MNSEELKRRIWFTLGALLVYRIGSHIPLPGINLGVWEQFFQTGSGGLLGMASTLSGGAIARLSVFSLSIVPYVSAAILVQLASFVVPALRAQRGAGEKGRRRVDVYTIALTVPVAAVQAYGIAGGLLGVNGLVTDPGSFFTLVTVLTLVAGTLFVTWLAGQITERGFGNGIALVLCLGIVLQLPANILGTLELGRSGALSGNLVGGLGLLAVVLVVVVAFVEKARRLEPVEFVRAGTPVRQTANLAFKLNGAGVMPTVIASWVLVAPLLIASLLGAEEIVRVLSPGHPVFILCYAILIFLSVYLYTAFVLDPSAAAERLQRCGGAIPHVEPGEATAVHLDRVLSRVTLMGAAYFVTVCLIPDLLLLWAQVPFYLGGTSLLILVCTVLDMENQARELALIK